MREITPNELKSMIEEKAEFQLIDVREIYEHEIANIGGELIPLALAIDSSDKIRQDIPVVIYCRSGMRSAMAISELGKRFGYENLINLKGGILAYAKEVDPSLSV